MPPVPAPGVPERTPPTAPTPPGIAPVIDMVGAGTPVAVAVNVPRLPTVKVVLLALVITGPVLTVSVKTCEAGAPTPLVAVIVIGKLPELAGLPERTPLGLSVTPPGSEPV